MINFVLGFIFSIVLISIIITSILYKGKTVNSIFSIKYSQTDIHRLIKPLLPLTNTNITSVTKRQSLNHINQNTMKVIITKGMAYWIFDNQFYTAKVVDGEIDKENAQIVDTMGMDKVELDKMLFIIDQLRKGS